jgi:hypothetical protein
LVDRDGRFAGDPVVPGASDMYRKLAIEAMRSGLADLVADVERSQELWHHRTAREERAA